MNELSRERTPWRAAVGFVAGVVALWGACALDACTPRAEPPAALWIGGDVHLGAGGKDILGPLTRGFAGAAGFVNLEGPMVKGVRPELPVVNGDQVPARLRAAGVTWVGIANNHARDAGPDGPGETAAALQAAGLVPVGGSQAGIVTLAGVRVALTAHDLEHGVPRTLTSDLESARRSADRLIATFHVASSESYLPSSELRAAADVAFAHGADVVAAHGTHQVGAIERRGPRVVAWGLGNLAFDCDCSDEDEAIVLRLVPRARGFDVEVIPIEAGLHGRRARRSPDPDGIFDLLEALGSPRFERRGARGTLGR